MIGADSIAVVLDVLEPERAALVALLEGLEPDDWVRPTECPAYSIKGVATHVLGDDLSLLSRQRDGAEDGLVQLARDRPGADFRTLLDTFNDSWVAAAGFLSTEPCRAQFAQPVVEHLAAGHLREPVARCRQPVQPADAHARVEADHVLAPLAELEDVHSVRHRLSRFDLDQHAHTVVVEPEAGRVAQDPVPVIPGVGGVVGSGGVGCWCGCGRGGR